MKKFFLIASVFSVITVSAQTITRKAGLVKGQQLEEVNKVNMNITQEMAGQKMDIKMESTITTLVEVKDALASGFAVSSTLKKVLMNMDMMGQTMTFDSDKKEDLDGKMGDAYRDNINMARDFTLSKDGFITEAKSADDKKVDGGMMENMMGGLIEPETVGSSFNSLANIPVKGVKKGQSWSDSASDGKSKSVVTYTLKDIKGNEGLVSSYADLAVNREVEQQGMQMQIDMKGTTTGEYNFDVSTGIITSKKSTTKATGTLEVMGQSVPLTMETTVTSVVSKK